MRRLRQDVARMQAPVAPAAPSLVTAAIVRDTASGSAALSDAVADGLPDVDLTTLNTALAQKLAQIDGRIDALEPP